jgi:hypothetical protein
VIDVVTRRLRHPVLATFARARFVVLTMATLLAFDGLGVLLARSPGAAEIAGGPFPAYLSVLLLIPLGLSVYVLIIRAAARAGMSRGPGAQIAWAAFAYSTGNLAAYMISGFGLIGVAPSDPVGWFLPAGLLGVTLTLFGATGRGRPEVRVPWASVLLVLLPVPLGILATYPPAGGSSSNVLVGAVLLASAFLVESGSISLELRVPEAGYGSRAPTIASAVPNSEHGPGPPPVEIPRLPAVGAAPRPSPAREEQATSPPGSRTRDVPTAASLLAFERALLGWQGELAQRREELSVRERDVADKARLLASREVALARRVLGIDPATLPSPSPDGSPVSRIASIPDRDRPPSPGADAAGPTGFQSTGRAVAVPDHFASSGQEKLDPPGALAGSLEPMARPSPSLRPSGLHLAAPFRSEPSASEGLRLRKGDDGPAHPETLHRGGESQGWIPVLFGGLEPGSSVAIVSSTGSAQTVVGSFLLEGLRQGESVVAINLSPPADRVRSMLAETEPGPSDEHWDARLRWVDASSANGTGSRGVGEEETSDPEARSYFTMLSRFISAIRSAESSSASRVRVGVFGVAGILEQGDHQVEYAFLRNLISLLKGRNMFGALELEASSFDRPWITTVTSRTSRTMWVRAEGERCFGGAVPEGGATTLDWVELPVGRSALEGGALVPGQ